MVGRRHTGQRRQGDVRHGSLFKDTGLGRPNALSKKFTEASQLGLRMKLWVFRIV